MIAPQIAVPPSGPQGGPQNGPSTYLPQQGVGQSGLPPMRTSRASGPMQRLPMPRLQGQRWGGQIGGRWIGGVQAPGGWGGYRRPGRGFALPRYWIAPSFFIGNYASYGLAPPPSGYSWSRYYDDAVLIDGSGRVYDSVSGIGWEGQDRSDDDRYDDGSRDHRRDDRRDDDRRYRDPPPPYGAPYAAPYPPAYPSAAPVVQPLYPHGYTQSWSAGSSYYYPGGVTTTITVQQAPVVTTTVTEYVEETVYRPPVRRAYRKPVRKWHAKPKCSCTCGC
ncbi:MAG: hypothetical protein B7Y47_06780 [Sphingomonas sp. 28-63-12]|nr:MAG: hypothetical protein B7Y47_06780 [Sphingomonas sp. 28-63-12]